MDNLNELKALWLTAKTDNLPGSEEMVKFIKKFRNRKIAKKIRLIGSACLLGGVMVGLLVTGRSTFAATRIGELMVVAAAVILATTNVRSIKRFYKLADCSNKEFLQFIEQTRLNQLYYYKKTQFVGLLLCSAGLLLLLYEPVHQNTAVFVAVYASVMVYLLVVWLVIRPRKFKKGLEQLEATKQRLAKLVNQLN